MEKKTDSNFQYMQRVRAVLFYVSIALFIAGLPFLLSNALGYKFDPQTFRFTKTGLLVLKTQPEGAEIYFNGRLLKEKTPTTINELFPGTYFLELRLQDHYPWSANVGITAGRVTSYEHIIFFPSRPDIKQLNKQTLSSFYVDRDKNAVYYFDNKAGLLYTSDLDGNDYEAVAETIPLNPLPLRYKLSPDRKKIAYFNQRQIGISFLRRREDDAAGEPPFVLEFSKIQIRDVFWHSNNSYLILVTSKDIEALELRSDAEPLVLLALNKRNPSVFYDDASDTLYFQDSERAADGKMYDNVYKLELKQNAFAANLEEFMQRTADE